MDRAFGEVEAHLGTVSVVVLNAGIYPIVPLEETTAERWRKTLDVNLTGPFLCARRAMLIAFLVAQRALARGLSGTGLE